MKGFEVLAGGLRSTKVDVLDGYWETLKVGFGDVEIDLIPSVMKFADLVDHLRAGRVEPYRRPEASEVAQGQRFSCGP